MRGNPNSTLLLAAVLLTLTANANATTLGPGTHIVNGSLIVTVPAGSTVTITQATSTVTVGTTVDPVDPVKPDDPADPSDPLAEKVSALVKAAPTPEKEREAVASLVETVAQSFPTAAQIKRGFPTLFQVLVANVSTETKDAWLQWEKLLLAADSGGDDGDVKKLWAAVAKGLVN